MLLAHRIRLKPTSAQCEYFERAAGTARRVWNWALAEWHRLSAQGQTVRAFDLKKHFNAIKYSAPEWLDEAGHPWLKAIHRDAHAQPFINLGKAFSRYLEARRKDGKAHPPRFKKKGRCRDSFYVANDKFRLQGQSVVLPKVGQVGLCEQLRFPGRVMGASVVREGRHWFLSVQVDVPDTHALRLRSGNETVGVDVGISTAVTLSTGEKLSAPRPLRAAIRRLRIRHRRRSRKLCPGSGRAPRSANAAKAALALGRLYARIRYIREDWIHKLTTRLCRENQALAVENLNIRAMLGNRRLTRAIIDLAWYRIRAQLAYKAKRYGTLLVVADRWFPSSKMCSVCCARYEGLALADRFWTCDVCGSYHDRDKNAALNLKRLATGAFEAQTALPVATEGGDVQDCCRS